MTIIASFIGLALGMLSAETPAECHDARVAALVRDHPVLALCSSTLVIAEADSVCDVVLDEAWETFWPEDLYDRVSPGAIASGTSWLCGVIAALPSARRPDVVKSLEVGVAAYLTVRSLEDEAGFEALPSAIARVPAVADLLPPDRSDEEADVSSTLASAEFAELHHRLALRIASVAPRQREMIVQSLRTELRELAAGDE